MTPEMRRIVAEAETAGRDGWSDKVVASLAGSTRGLRCDADELVRLLALPEADHGFREEVFMTDPSFHASVFALAEGETIPLHDHPRMDVISKVLRGRARVRTYEWVDAAALRARACGELILGEDDGALVLRKSPGTLHTITALEGTAFLDLFAPYYDDVARPCRYYKEVGGDTATTVRFRVVTWEEARQ